MPFASIFVAHASLGDNGRPIAVLLGRLPQAPIWKATPMLNLRQPPKRAWPDQLRKFGDGDHCPEAFEPWWAWHGAELAHLHPQVAEQWVHRHFDQTWFSFIPLPTLR
ncbi:MAG: hypothetical protein DI537_32130 [Stutzerimonas stutzeri]|nr:MAG: hypothetical protein DI537_32130 [Stutzerimonas stutzeri]